MIVTTLSRDQENPRQATYDLPANEGIFKDRHDGWPCDNFIFETLRGPGGLRGY